MAAVTTTLLPQPAYTQEPIFRLTVDQYHELISRGKLTSDDPVELIEGLLVYKMSKNEPHIASARRCRRILEAALPAGYFYDVQDPITLGDGEPEPDGMVIRGAMEDYDRRKPTPADVPLLIEVADSTLERDQTIKLRSYARAGIACYWIINLIDRQIEVYTQPDSTAAEPRYHNTQVFKPGDTLPVVIDEKCIAQVAVSDVLPH